MVQLPDLEWPMIPHDSACVLTVVLTLLTNAGEDQKKRAPACVIFRGGGCLLRSRTLVRLGVSCRPKAGSEPASALSASPERCGTTEGHTNLRGTRAG